MNEKNKIQTTNYCDYKYKFKTSVPPNREVFLQRLRLSGKSRSYQELLESKNKHVGNHAFFRDN